MLRTVQSSIITHHHFQFFFLHFSTTTTITTTTTGELDSSLTKKLVRLAGLDIWQLHNVDIQYELAVMKEKEAWLKSM